MWRRIFSKHTECLRMSIDEIRLSLTVHLNRYGLCGALPWYPPHTDKVRTVSNVEQQLEYLPPAASVSHICFPVCLGLLGEES